jgi:hypothetical protein
MKTPPLLHAAHSSLAGLGSAFVIHARRLEGPRAVDSKAEPKLDAEQFRIHGRRASLTAARMLLDYEMRGSNPDELAMRAIDLCIGIVADLHFWLELAADAHEDVREAAMLASAHVGAYVDGILNSFYYPGYLSRLEEREELRNLRSFASGAHRETPNAEYCRLIIAVRADGSDEIVVVKDRNGKWPRAVTSTEALELLERRKP